MSVADQPDEFTPLSASSRMPTFVVRGAPEHEHAALHDALRSCGLSAQEDVTLADIVVEWISLPRGTPLATMTGADAEAMSWSTIGRAVRALAETTQPMADRRAGRVVVVVSDQHGGAGAAALRQGLSAGMVALAQTAAREVAGRGVTVNVVRTGPLATGGIHDLVRTVVALCRADAAFVTGQALDLRPPIRSQERGTSDQESRS